MHGMCSIAPPMVEDDITLTLMTSHGMTKMCSLAPPLWTVVVYASRQSPISVRQPPGDGDR